MYMTAFIAPFICANFVKIKHFINIAFISQVLFADEQEIICML